MKEDFLHYIWKFKKFDFRNLKTINGETLTIINVGQHLENSGPDFFNGQIIINDQKWAGNIEIHINASDWYLHQHERDSNYDNVILHVVWSYDTPIYNKSNSEIPVLQLRDFVPEDLLESYRSLSKSKSWIFCENQLATVDDFLLQNWLERLYIERLEDKAEIIFDLLKKSQNDWEAVLFVQLVKNFGLNYNGKIFQDNLFHLPFSVVRKECFNLSALEALLFGYNGLLGGNIDDVYCKELQASFVYLQQKYQLENAIAIKPQFFKLRPDNFPTIRLAQLANLFHSQPQLFSKILEAKSIEELYQLFAFSTSKYWEEHYNFGLSCDKKNRKLSKAFKDLLIVNTVIPMLFAYHKSQDNDGTEALLAMIQNVSAESNHIIDKFKNYQVEVKNALQSQSLLQLKNNYCEKYKCLQCNIGISILKNHDAVN